MADKSIENNQAGEAPSLADIDRAYARIRSALPLTPLTYSPAITELLGRDVFFKWDNKFKTGSFKERGVVNFLAELPEEARARGVCTASAGNHAMALSHHAARLGIPCAVIMPVGAPLVKIEHTTNSGAKVELAGNNLGESIEIAHKKARDLGMTFVPPYNDPRIVAGQGTAGLEILEQLPDFDALVVPVGGGGLIAGIATVLKARRPNVWILGVQSEWVKQHEQHALGGRKDILPMTIADGIAVKTLGAVTKPVIEKLVDQLVTVNDQQVAKSIIQFLELERTLVEGAGAAGLAALGAGLLDERYRKVAVLVSGSNIDTNMLWRLIETDMGERGRLLRLHLSIPDSPGALHRTTGAIAEKGANVLQAYHDRKFSHMPGRVEVTFVLEVRNARHKQEMLEHLRSLGFDAVEIR